MMVGPFIHSYADYFAGTSASTWCFATRVLRRGAIFFLAVCFCCCGSFLFYAVYILCKVLIVNYNQSDDDLV